MKIGFTKEQLIEAVKNSSTYADVCRNLNTKNPHNYKTIKKYIQIYEIDTSHFSGVSRLKGKKITKIKRNIKEFLTENSFINTRYLKQKLINEELLIYKCETCGLSTWNDKKITLELDHINGVNTDNRLENLRLLCPNCHSQTETYCRNNIKKKAPKLCKYCEAPVHKNSVTLTCKKCFNKKPKRNQINWPPIEFLTNLVNEFGYLEAGRRLNVSDNAVRKHIKKYQRNITS